MADHGREVEFKFRVEGPEAFEALAVAAGTRPSPPALQTNHFFDTPDRALGMRRYTLRLREEDGRFRLTAKGPSERVANRTTRTEEEIEVSAEEARAIVHGVHSGLDVLQAQADPRAGEVLATMRSIVGTRPLRHMGSFQNVRARLPVRLIVEGRALPLTFELDRATFPGEQVHHEVEVEIGGADVRAVGPALHAFFTDAGVAWREAPSKSRRFFEAAAGRPI